MLNWSNILIWEMSIFHKWKTFSSFKTGKSSEMKENENKGVSIVLFASS